VHIVILTIAIATSRKKRPNTSALNIAKTVNIIKLFINFKVRYDLYYFKKVLFVSHLKNEKIH